MTAFLPAQHCAFPLHLSLAKRFLAGLTCIACLFTPAWAQPDHRSHRILPAPQHASGDLSTQFRAMQQLQQMMGNQAVAHDTAAWEATKNSLQTLSRQLLDSQDLESIKLDPKILDSKNLDSKKLEQVLQSLDPDQREQWKKLAESIGSQQEISTSEIQKILTEVKQRENPSLRNLTDPRIEPLQQNGPLPTRQPNTGQATNELTRPPTTPSNKSKITTDSVSELWKKSRQQPSTLPPLKLPPNLSDKFTQWMELMRKKQTAKNQTNQFLRQIRDSLPPSLQNELARSGIEKSMRDIMQSKDNDSLQPAVNRKSDTNASLKSNTDTLEKKSNGWLEKLTLSVRPSPARDQSSKAIELPGESEKKADLPSSSGASKSFSESVKETYEKWTRPASSFAKKSWRFPDMKVASYPILAILALTIFLVAVFSGLQMKKQERQVEGNSSVVAKPNELGSIQTRADVVSAFHAIVASSRLRSHPWWPHSKAAMALASDDPSKQSALKVLCDHYAVARYARDSFAFTEPQLEEVRQVVQEIRRCVKE